MLPTGGLTTGRANIGELPQHVQGLLDVPGQGDGIEGVKLLGEGVLLRGGEHARGEHPLVGRQRGVVMLEDLAADPAPAAEFADGAEEVVLQAEQAAASTFLTASTW